MCGKISAYATPKEYQVFLNLLHSGDVPDNGIVETGERLITIAIPCTKTLNYINKLVKVRWGFYLFENKYLKFARIESFLSTSTSSWHNILQRSTPALVPITSWEERKGIIRLSKLRACAALYNEEMGGVVVLTCCSDKGMKDLTQHERQPLILDPTKHSLWMKRKNPVQECILTPQQ